MPCSQDTQAVVHRSVRNSASGAPSLEGKVSRDRCTLAVIGGGVSGITTAVLLQLYGLSTALYTQDLPTTTTTLQQRKPEFATIHAAASIIPHSVRSTHVTRWASTSKAFFEVLAFCANAGIRRQTHYELFETLPEAPVYADAVDDFQVLTRLDFQRHRIPVRSGAHETVGWRFNSYFCEAPTYLRHLYKLYRALGGEVHLLRTLGIDGWLPEYVNLGHNIIVNCSGYFTTRLLSPRFLGSLEDAPVAGSFEPLLDPWPARVIRGHYLRVDLHEPLVNELSEFISYNYTPVAEVYPSPAGGAADVYCYPRSDGWLLGGSRQPSKAASDDTIPSWPEVSQKGIETMPFAGPGEDTIFVPRPIFTLNAELVDNVSGGAVSLERLYRERPNAFAAGIGYRFERSHPIESIRLSRSRIRTGGREAAIVHNYGHGGAGFTLSWGCAMEVLELLIELGNEDEYIARVLYPDSDSVELEMQVSMLSALLARRLKDKK
jgi:D-amino-acid oxidase